MKIKFLTDEKVVFENLLWEIGQKTEVKKKKLVSFLPPDKILNGKKSESLKNYFNKIYSNKFQANAIELAKKRWKPFESQFAQALGMLKDLKQKKEYLVYLTLFGPGGAFEYPNKIFLRIKTKDDKEYLDVNLAHEMIHLILHEKLVHFSYVKREKIVNAVLFQKEFAGIFNIKNSKIENSSEFKQARKFF